MLKKTSSSSGNQDKIQRIINRLNREIYYSGKKQINLRNSIKDYLINVLMYMFLRFKPKVFAYEKLKLNPDKKEGGLAEIINSMFSDLKQLLYIVERRMKSYGLEAYFPDLLQVSASNTSRFCFVCHHMIEDHEITELCVLDNSMSYDYSPCFCCKKIYDRHINAAQNIAYKGLIEFEEANKKNTAIESEEK